MGLHSLLHVALTSVTRINLCLAELPSEKLFPVGSLFFCRLTFHYHTNIKYFQLNVSKPAVIFFT